MTSVKKAQLALAAVLVLAIAGALFIVSSNSAEGTSLPMTTAATVTPTPSKGPSQADLDAMVNACAKYMSQVPGAPAVTSQQMKDMMKGMMGSGGMMGR